MGLSTPQLKSHAATRWSRRTRSNPMAYLSLGPTQQGGLQRLDSGNFNTYKLEMERRVQVTTAKGTDPAGESELATTISQGQD